MWIASLCGGHVEGNYLQLTWIASLCGGWKELLQLTDRENNTLFRFQPVRRHSELGPGSRGDIGHVEVLSK